jgi:CRP-like cAMP-binding protein
MQTFVEQLAELPLFSDLSANQLHRLLEVFEEHRVASGEVLFEAGSAPSTVWLLVKGSLSVRDTSGEVLQISPPAQVGELSALTGEDRNLSAVAATPCALLGAPVATFQRFLEANGAIAFVVHRNLLRVAARKLGRDRRRLTEMRDNIKGTQRAMKIMRDALLESEDTPLHAALFEQLDALVEQNRKIHYLVEPSRMVPTDFRLDGAMRPVRALSREWLYFASPPPDLQPGAEVSGELILDGVEIAVSGRVERVSRTEASVYLDNLIPDYDATLVRHLSRAQLLDVVL